MLEDKWQKPPARVYEDLAVDGMEYKAGPETQPYAEDIPYVSP
jgi:hypothetical protein